MSLHIIYRATAARRLMAVPATSLRRRAYDDKPTTTSYDNEPMTTTSLTYDDDEPNDEYGCLIRSCGKHPAPTLATIFPHIPAGAWLPRVLHVGLIV